MEEARNSDRRNLRPRRKPLGDLTNISSSHRFSNAAESVKPRLKSNVIPENSIKSSVSSAGSSDPKNTEDRRSPKFGSVAVSGVFSSLKSCLVGSKNGGQSSVKLQNAKEKRKEQKDVSFAAASSCPPQGRTRRLRENALMKHGMNQNEACSEPCQKKKRRRVAEDIPLQDFIRQQRAYFAEVDSFELPEEVASESEL